MNISMALMPYIMLFIIVIPTVLAVRLAKKQGRSMLTSGMVTFALGFTWIGGWIYLGIMNLIKPKKSEEK